ncbi:MAG: IgGFc-binding protein [Kofleriaceae bacterium]
MTRPIVVAVLAVLAACGPNAREDGSGDDDGTGTCPVCSADNTAVVDCDGNQQPCPLDQLCSAGGCQEACAAADANHSSVGCDYYGVDMDGAEGPPKGGCYTMFVANTSRENVHMSVEWSGIQIDLAQFAKIPIGTGQSLAYGAYNPQAGLEPGQVAILFLSYSPGFMHVACPVPAATGAAAQIGGTGMGKAFHLTTDLPVVAYQMLPYGGGAAAATGASLLLPTSSWGDNYVAVSAMDPSGPPPPISVPQGPSHNVVAKEDGTMVTIRPKSAITAGAGLPAGAANEPYTFMLNRGEYAQITQAAPLSGSPITATKPVGVFGGHQIMSVDKCCGDHGEQMLAPVRALGSEYVAAPHPERRPGVSEMRIYRIYGAVDGTALTYDPPNVGAATLGLGGMIEIRTADPFVVRSQDTSHPFAMFTYMTGSGELGEGGIGDPDFVRLVPPPQYMFHYVFFTDPTYPFTNLTVVRAKKGGSFYDVDLKCMGNITTWRPVGSGDYEIAFISMVDHWNGQAGCNNGVQEMSSGGPFGVWVWGWGSEDTSTGWVSYGYPAGENVLPINDVIIY